MLIVNAISHDRGWSPIQHMIATAGELFECEVVAGKATGVSKTSKLLSILRQRSRSESRDEVCLIVCKGPADLISILNIENWRKRFRFLMAWTIDSFWTEQFPRAIRLRSPFDHFFVTSLEDVEPWRRITGVETTWLPWGTDALRLGGSGSERQWDLMRVGRQPPEWDDDIGAAAAAAPLGIAYRGRPDSGDLNALQNQKLMMKAYGTTKFTLAFSNAVNCDPNNHPTREYLTGRWVDALGCGSVVAGVPPRGANSDGLLWPGATLDLGSIRRNEGLKVIGAAVAEWKPAVAAANYFMALKRLDWRWRFKTIADTCKIRSATLTQELKSLEDRIARLTAAPIQP